MTQRPRPIDAPRDKAEGPKFLGPVSLFAGTLALVLWGALAWAGNQEVSEYQVKAAYLFNFAKFVAWPRKVFAGEGGALVIGVLGEDPFEEALDEVVKDKVVDRHPIRIVRFPSYRTSQVKKLRECQILFISYSERNRMVDILASLQGANVLTVSDVERFPLFGGEILFDQVGKRIGLVINPEAVRKAGLEVSSRLLQVAKIYRRE